MDFFRQSGFGLTFSLIFGAVWSFFGVIPVLGDSETIRQADAQSVRQAIGKGVSVTGLSVGIDGCYKNGFLTPARVFIRRDGADSGSAEFLVQLESTDPDGTPTYYEKRGFWTDSSKGGAVSFLFSTGRENAPLIVRILHPETKAVLTERTFTPGEANAADSDSNPSDDDCGETSDEASNVNFPKPIGNEQPIWLTLGGEAAGLDAMLNSLQLPQDRTPHLLKLKSLSDLPETADGLDAVDLIVFSASNPEYYSTVTPPGRLHPAAPFDRGGAFRPLDGKTQDEPAYNAGKGDGSESADEDKGGGNRGHGNEKTSGADADLPSLTPVKDWILRGGKGVVFGSEKGLTLLKTGGILADFVPGTIRSDSWGELRTAPNLVQFVPKAKNLVMLGSLDSPYLRFPLLERTADGATVELAEEGATLWVRGPMGMGTIHFFATDPDAPPLADWSGRNGLLMKIFASDIDLLTAGGGESGLIQLGYNDLSGQMRSGLDRFEGVRNLPFSVILSLIFLFVLAVGPVDWFLTHRVFKKPNLTWLTLPIWLLIFGWTAWGIEKSFRPDDIRVNRVDLIDFDVASGIVRGTAWTGLYSPVDARHDFSLVPVIDDAFRLKEISDVRLTWLGLAGRGLGGMSSPIRSVHPWPVGYRVEDNGDLDGFPIQVRSTKSLFGSWFAEIASPPAARLTDRDGLLSGTIENRFGGPLQNALLLYRGRIYLLGSLQPGENEIGRTTPKTDEVERILIGSTNPFDERMGDFDAAAWPKYSDVSADPEAILRLLIFYRLAGGRKASGLSDSSHARLDASELYAAGRAVLFGKWRGFQDGIVSSAPCRTDLTIHHSGTDEKRLLATDAERERGDLDRHAVFVRFFIPVEREDGERTK